MEETFRIAEVNAMPTNQLTALFRQCLAVDRWADELAGNRPYADRDQLLTRADTLSASLTDDELHRALDDHPRIGARTKAGSMAATEQSGVDGDALAERLLAANRVYEDRFGHLYLVAAAGRSGEELLADATERMANDPATELNVVRRQLGKIARLRLTKIIGR